MTEEFRSGFVTLVGRPNAGKSTLINAVVGHKVAITSNTAQTTRHRFRAIVTREDMQMIMVDTPGMHKPHDALGEELNTSAIKAMEDVDVVAFLVDASKPVGTGDEWVARQVREVRGARKILVISKADLVSKETAIQQLEAARALGTWDDEVVLSSKNGFNVEGFVQAVAKWLPEGPKWFPEDMDTDQPFEVLVAEFIREKILRSYRDEVPHSIGVVASNDLRPQERHVSHFRERLRRARQPEGHHHRQGWRGHQESRHRSPPRPSDKCSAARYSSTCR